MGLQGGPKKVTRLDIWHLLVANSQAGSRTAQLLLLHSSDNIGYEVGTRGVAVVVVVVVADDDVGVAVVVA